ncbi:MAG: hypothetical protein OEU32_18090, partial [Acidimicrobiia bacterium]|nr:hypothetical protein [Acidimicrobiia bacterium]
MSVPAPSTSTVATAVPLRPRRAFAIVAVAAALCAAALVPASSSAAGDPTGDRPDAPDDRVATAHTTGP